MTASLPFAARRDEAELAAPEPTLAAILDELRGLRADLRRARAADEPALIRALDEYFGAGRFTVSGCLSIAEDEPHGPIAEALAKVVDLGASPRSRATALGLRLRRLPAVEIVAEQRGCAVYRLRTWGE